MGHNFFSTKKIISLVLFVLASSFLNLVNSATPAFADDGCRYFVTVAIKSTITSKQYFKNICINDLVDNGNIQNSIGGTKTAKIRSYIQGCGLRSSDINSLVRDCNVVLQTEKTDDYGTTSWTAVGGSRQWQTFNNIGTAVNQSTPLYFSEVDFDWPDWYFRYTLELRGPQSGTVYETAPGRSLSSALAGPASGDYTTISLTVETPTGNIYEEEPTGAGNVNPVGEAEPENPEVSVTQPESTENTCHGTAGAIGWILCPILEGAADAAQWAYTTVIEPSLQTNPELFKIDGETNGTYQAWSIFRNIANVLFAILFLFVIFSQVSGIGIDNYGIKKSLPKLIVAAFLINLSFFICQLCVDLSNILGNGLYGLLNSIANGIHIEVLSGTTHMSSTGSIVVGITELVAAGVIGTLIGGTAFWAAIGSALLAFVPVLISAVVAVLFLFVLLAARQAVVVVLVAISPLAFVAYILPNTKRLFDRWAQILRGMLLMYPTCALLVAGGRLASRIIFSSGAGQNNIGVILTAMAAEIIPLFFIPTVVRSAYNATGHLGAALGNLHGRMVGGTRNGIRNSQRFQRATQRQQYRRAAIAANPNSGFMRRYRAASASSNPIAQAYARWATNRAGAIQQNANNLAAQQGALAGWATAGPNAAQNAYNQARTSTQQQLINQANYGTAEFNAAIIHETTAKADDARKRQLMWNSASYVAGKEAEALTARQNEAANAVQYGTPGYADRERLKNQAARDRAAAENATWTPDRVTAERTKAEIEAEAQRENVLHYNDAGFATGVRMKNEAEAAKSLHDTKNWDADRRKAEIAKGEVESDAQRENALLYNKTGFADRERIKNQADTGRREAENATWDDDRRKAVVHKARIESEAQSENDVLYNDSGFRAREERRLQTDTEKRKIENKSWTPNRAKGEIRKAEVDAKAQRENAELYADNDFAVREEKRNATDIKKRKIENATWTDKRARGEVYKAEIEAGAQQANAELYTKTAVREGEQRKNEAQTKIKEAEARSWTEQRASGEVHKAQLDARAQEANANLYNSAAYRAHEQIRNETQTETKKIENATWTDDRRTAEVARAKNEALRTELNSANYGDARFVAGERNKIRTDAERTHLETATWTDARRTGEIEKAKIETEAQKDNAMLYNRTAFREGEQRKSEAQTKIRRAEGESWTADRAAGEVERSKIETERAEKSATNYTDPKYAQGKRNEVETMSTHEFEQTKNWAAPDFTASKAAQLQNARNVEVRKMYTEQFAPMDKFQLGGVDVPGGAKEGELLKAMRAASKGISDPKFDPQRATERVDAAFGSLLAIGAEEEALESLRAIDTATIQAMHPTARKRLLEKAVTSGSLAMKGWGKSQLKALAKGGTVVGFDAYLTTGDTGGENGSFADFMRSEGKGSLNGASKDLRKVISLHVPPENIPTQVIVNASVSTQGGEEVRYANDIIRQKIDGGRKADGTPLDPPQTDAEKQERATRGREIAGTYTGDQITHMDPDTFETFRQKAEECGEDIKEWFAPAVKALRGSKETRAKVDNAILKALGLDSASSTPESEPAPATSDAPENPPENPDESSES